MKIIRTEERLVLELKELSEYKKAAQEILDWIGTEIKVLLLTGDLGAGKTTLAQAICRELGVKQAVTSPTYAIVNEYDRDDGKGPVYHMDLYRLKDLEEALQIGMEEYLDSSNYCLIEWPEIIDPLLNGEEALISVERVSESMRKMLILKATD